MVVRQFFILFLLLSLSCQILAGGKNYGAGGKYNALSQSGITITDHWANFYNQAALAELENLRFGIYAERKFGIESLNAGALSIAYPINDIGTVGISFHQFSNGPYFGQQKYGLAISRSFGENLSAGLQFDAFNTFIREYGNEWQIMGEASLLFRLNDKIKTAIHVFNPTAQGWEAGGKKETPPTFNLGASYKFSEKVAWHLAFEKSISYDTRFKSGLTYSPVEKLQLQTGVSTAPFSYSFGLRYRWKWLTVNLNFDFHQTLGITPALSTNYIQQ